MTKVITMCHWRRPDYTKTCLEYLSRCLGISDYTVIMHIDGGGDSKTTLVCKRFQSSRKVFITVKPNHIGCNQNTLEALSQGFELSDYVIHIEDDVLVAHDGLRFLEWARQFDGDARIFTTGIWRHHEGWLPEQRRPWKPGQERWAGLYPGFFVWGWATWVNRWVEMRSGWTTGNDKNASWDTILTRNVRGKRYSFLPYISRANNIGEHLGTHRGASWLSHWADSPGFIEPGRFERV